MVDNMATIKEKLTEELKSSLKAGRKEEVAAIRLTLSEINSVEKEKKRSLDEDETLKLLRTAVKKRKESIKLFRQGAREDLAVKEEAELLFLQKYLPAELDGESLRSLVEEGVRETGASSAKDIGAVMKWLMPKVGGRADGSEVSKIVREILSRGDAG